MTEEDVSIIILPMEADDSDFFLNFEEFLGNKRLGVTISCKTSLPVTRSFNCFSVGQAGSRSRGHRP